MAKPAFINYPAFFISSNNHVCYEAGVIENRFDECEGAGCQMKLLQLPVIMAVMI